MLNFVRCLFPSTEIGLCFFFLLHSVNIMNYSGRNRIELKGLRNTETSASSGPGGRLKIVKTSEFLDSQ